MRIIQTTNREGAEDLAKLIRHSGIEIERIPKLKDAPDFRHNGLVKFFEQLPR
jgi:hypothetical protein